jgi:uncharacterized protein YqeY
MLKIKAERKNFSRRIRCSSLKNTDKRSMLIETIDQDIKKAMLAKDEARLRGLRAIKSALLLARTEKGASEVISEETELKVLQKLIKQRKESAEIYQSQNRDDLYQIEKEEMQVIEAYLPQQMSREEITVYLQDLIKKTGATSVKEMGKVMGAANKELAGKADGKTISEIVKQLLQ